MWGRRPPPGGAKRKEFDWFLSRLSKVDVGVCREVIRTQNKRLPRMLHAQLGAYERETLALDCTPDLFSAGKMWVRLAQLHGEDFDGDDPLNRGQAVLAAVKVMNDVIPVAARSRFGKG